MAILTPLVRKRMRVAIALAVPCLLTLVVALVAGSPSAAMPPPAAASAPAVSRAVAIAPSTGDWTSLSPARRAVLEPLQARWATLAPASRAQWLRVADDLQTRSPGELRRAQSHMRAWASLSRGQRAQARRRFKSESRITADERHRRWAAYRRRRDATRTAATAAPPQGVAPGDQPANASPAPPASPPSAARQAIDPQANLRTGDSS